MPTKNDSLTPSIVRTIVPYVVSFIVSFLATRGITIDDTMQANLLTLLTLLGGFIYYIIARLREKQTGKPSALLLSKTLPGKYVEEKKPN